VVNYHLPVVTASSYKAPSLKDPSPIVYNSTLLLAFTIGTDQAFRQLKINNEYTELEDVKFHVHWTKSTDVNEQNKNVRWRVGINSFNGSSQQIPATINYEIEDTYEAADTTERTIYRTSDVPIGIIDKRYYIGLSVEAIAPVGVALADEPALYSVDFTYPIYYNKS
ncbi:MAG: hypothetical protein KDC90_17870, partial [Ignavibacteriae bacterium]|nr:hypothetical protein [Ignavibacteriota bacterium]